MKCKHCPEDTGDDQIDVCEKCWKIAFEARKAEAARRRPNYRAIESCSSCKHCFTWWDPETWDGSCNVEGDVPITTREEHMKLLYGRRKYQKEAYHKLSDWQSDNRVYENRICDRYEKGKPQGETDSEPRKPRRKREKSDE